MKDYSIKGTPIRAIDQLSFITLLEDNIILNII